MKKQLPNSESMASSSAIQQVAALHGGYGLRWRFVVAISALVALVLALVVVVLVLFVHSFIKEDIRREVRAYGTLATAPICEAYRNYFGSGYSKFRELIAATIALNPDVARLAIYDIEGEQLFSSNRMPEVPPAADAIRPRAEGRLLEAVRSLEIDAWDVRADVDAAQHLVVVPYVEEWGGHQYSVAFWTSYDGLHGAAGPIGWRVVCLALSALALGGGCAYLLSAQSLRPVEQLTQAARHLARGDLSYRVHLDSKDEFAILGATLNHMAHLLSGTIQDIAASNEHLNRLNQELQELDSVKSDLLANVSHELRTPLTAISGYVEALRAGLLGDVTKMQQDSLRVVERNIVRLRSMFDQLLSYSRMESGHLEVELRPFDVESTARHVVEAVAAAHGHEMELLFECQPNLPEAYGDASRISQVLENLLTNAIKFSPAGKPVELHIGPAEAGIEVYIEDQGVGIPEDLQTKIFDRFYQVDAKSNRQFGGMGLGLAIVREILESHHSRIRVESAPGEGSRFSFVLPLAKEQTGMLPIAQGRRLVLIDDDSVFVQKVVAHMTEKGFWVQAAATAEQGELLVRRWQPELVLLDRLLPDQDGFDLLRRLRQDSFLGQIPIVLCTIRQERALGMRLGANDYWIKPLEPAEVEKRVLRLLGDSKGSDRAGAS